MASYLLGIDTGATVAKVVLFDLYGQAIHSVGQKVTTRYPAPGWTERDMDELWQSTSAAIRDLLTATGIQPQEIMGIGACGHGNGLYLLDRQGAALRPGIVSMDTRAADLVTGWQAQGIPEAIWPRILQPPYAGQPPALLRWLKRYEPERYGRIGAVLLAKDYIKFRLTGTITTDWSDISATGLLDLQPRSYTAELLEAYGIADIAGALPPIVESTAIVGGVSAEAARETGLQAGTPVAGGMFDVAAGALGAGIVAPGQCSTSAGTWGVTAVVNADVIASTRPIFNACYTPDSWLTVDASPTSSANLEWFIGEFCGEEQAEARRRGLSVYQVCGERIAALPPAGTSIVFHPFLFGAAGQPNARAGFYGLAGWHRRADLLRAVYEGVAYGHRSQVEQLLYAGARIESICLIGGGARSPVWAQMFADVLGRTIAVPQGVEIGARGAALGAGIGLGVYGSYVDAATRAVAIERVYTPDAAAAAHYRQAYAAYRQLDRAMRQPWDDLQRLERPEERRTTNDE
jgi:L-xylulokinase